MKLIDLVELKASGDHRGIAFRPISDEELQSKKIFNLHLVSLKPGAVRGNHFHQYQNEVICVFGSRCKVAAVNNKTGEREEETIEENKQVLLKIPTNVTHAVKNIGDKTLYLLCYSDKEYNPNNHDAVLNRILE